MGRGSDIEPAEALFGQLEPRHERWKAHLPIDLDELPSEQAAALEAAILTVLDSEPIAGIEPEPLYPASSDPAYLPEHLPRVLGVCGKPRAGKDVIADFIAAHFRGVERTSFSVSVIPEVNAYLAVQGTRHEINMGNKSEPIYRRLLQEWGMAQPTIDPDYWVKKTRAFVEERLAGRDGVRLVIVTGVRLPADAAMIKALGGEVWRASRPDNPYVAEHDVESGIDALKVDREIVNPVEGDLQPYEDNILAALAVDRQEIRAGIGARA